MSWRQRAVRPSSRNASGALKVAARVPASVSCLELLQSLGEPIVGTSANISGRAPLTVATDALLLLPGIDAILADYSVPRVDVLSRAARPLP